MKLTAQAIREKKMKGEKIAALSLYDYLFAQLADGEDIDIVLVGDSLGMMILGYESTLSVTMEDMLHHTQAVSRGVKKAFVVADMPAKSYDTPQTAFQNAGRFLSEAGADAVKLEGGALIEKQIRKLVASGIPVMGHLGLTPQTAHQSGGYRVHGRKPLEAREIFQDALLLDELGVFSLILECVPRALAEEITGKVRCPTIGIGAGAGTDGQILVLHDLLGFESRVKPKFVRRYESLGDKTRDSIRKYRDDVLRGGFPAPEESYS